MSYPNSEKKWQVSFVIFLALALVVIVGVYIGSSPSNDGAARLYQDYQRLPESAKIENRHFIARIVAAEPGDFIVRKDGTIMRIKSLNKDYNGLVELHVWSTTRMETYFTLRDWVVWAVVDRLVKQTDPDAGKVALKFLSQ